MILLEWKEVSAGRETAAGKSAKTGKGAGRPASRPARGAPGGGPGQKKQPVRKPPGPSTADNRTAGNPGKKVPAGERARKRSPEDPDARNDPRRAAGGRDNPSDGRPVRKKPARRGLRPGFFIGLVLVAVVVVVILSLTVLFPVTDIQVTGETRYTASQILEVSALKTGDNLLLADTDTAAARICKQLPYIGEVSISRRLPGTLVIEAVEADPVCALEREGKYLLLNEQDKVVDESIQKPAGLLLVRGMETEGYEKGTAAVFSNKDQEQLLRSLLDRLRGQGLPITLVDLSDMVQIRFVIDNRILVKFGTSGDLDKKLSHLLATYEQMETGVTGTLDMSWWSANKKDAYFKEGDLEETWLVPTAPPEGADDGTGGQAPGDEPVSRADDTSSPGGRTQGDDSSASSAVSDSGFANPPSSAG